MRGITQEEFAQIIEQHRGLVLTVCLSFTGNYFDAEDLAQETFLSAIRHIDRFDGASPKAWLVTIAANKCRDYLKSPARRADPVPGEDLARLEDPGGSVEGGAEERDTFERIRRLCRRLKEPYRSVAEAYFLGGRKLSELSAETGANLRTLQTQLYRARQTLRTLWKEESA